MVTAIRPLLCCAGRWSRLVVTLAAGCLCLAAAPAGAQSRERTLYVTARDAQGAVVAQLTPDNVTVREDGVAREVLRVAPATAPLQIALLVDDGAASARHTTNFRDALKAFVGRFGAPHEIAYVTLGDRPTIVTEYTTSTDALTKAIDRLFPRSGAGIYVLDGIAEAARGLQKREATRPVILVVTTDGTEFSNLSDGPVLDALAASGAALYVVVVQEGASGVSRSQEMRYRDIVFDRGPADSGGVREIVLTSMALPATLSAIADGLLRQFTVTYARPTTLIPPEKVTVTAARPGLVVRGTPARVASGERP